MGHPSPQSLEFSYIGDVVFQVYLILSSLTLGADYTTVVARTDTRIQTDTNECEII